ncbi:MAG: hypothetical protein V4538_01785 [Bacteroidota bacterium]
MKSRNNKQIKIDVPAEKTKSNGGSFGKILAFGILAGGAIVGYNYYAGKADAQAQGGAIQNDVFTQWASQLKNLIDGWTSADDIKEIIAIAGKITDYTKVSAAYTKLTNGNNLTNDLSDAMGLQEYQNFVIALNAKGAAVNNKKVAVGNGTNPTGYTANVTKLKLNTATAGVSLYKNLADYAGGTTRPLTFAQGASVTVTYISAHTATYTNMQPPLTVPVYKVALSNGSQYYISKSMVQATPLSGVDENQAPTPLCNGIGSLKRISIQ